MLKRMMKEIAMTHDELVQFAASKVGGEVCNPTGDNTAIKIAFKNGNTSGWEIHYLTSPDLMLKGMEVYHKDGAPFQISPWGVKLGFQNMTFDTIERIPEMFWQCWYEDEA